MLRRWVSGDRNRYVADDFDLDLCYVTDRIIAMSYPATGVASLYRNSRSEIKRFLDTKHTERYLVFNLCEESLYPPLDFSHRLNPAGAVEIPFENHSVPRLRQMAELCRQAVTWLETAEENVVVVHCLAGKGRTGLMISALLVLTQDLSAGEALLMFAQKRSETSTGVTVMCQKQWLHIFAELVSACNIGDASLQERVSRIDSLFADGRQTMLFKITSVSLSSTEAVYSVKVHTRNGKRYKFPADQLIACRTGLQFNRVVTVDEDFLLVIKLGGGRRLSSWFCLDNPMHRDLETLELSSEDGDVVVKVSLESKHL